MVIVNAHTWYSRLSDSGRHSILHKGYSMDEWLKDNIDNILVPSVKRKWDSSAVISGLEGSGKTTLACSIAAYLDPKFDLSRIVFSLKQFYALANTLPPESAIVWDEFVLEGMAQDSGSTNQRELIKYMTMNRKKRLYVFLVIPTIFLLRKYFAIHRTRFLIHCTSSDGISRGDYLFYSHETKRILWCRGIKEWDQYCVKHDWPKPGYFTDTDGYFFDPLEYDKKKQNAILGISDGLTDSGPKKEEDTEANEVLSINEKKFKIIFLKLLWIFWEHIKSEKVTYTAEDFFGLVLRKNGLNITTEASRYMHRAKVYKDIAIVYP